MDTHFSCDVDRARDRGTAGARDQGYDRPCATVRESGAYVEWSSSERLQISLFSVGSRRCVGRIFRSAPVGQATHRLGLPADPNTHWFFAAVPRSSLFIGRCLRSGSRGFERTRRLAFREPPNRTYKRSFSLSRVLLLRAAPVAQFSRTQFFLRRGGRAVECAGLENRKTERSREFESHPLRHDENVANLYD